MNKFAFLILLLAVCGTSNIASAATNSDYCISNRGTVVWLIDITTPYDERDKNVIVDGSSKILQQLEGGERLIIRTIGDDFTSSETLISACIPTCTENTLLGEWFNCSEGVIREDFRLLKNSVGKKLRERLLNFVELEYSDIIRTINQTATEFKQTGEFKVYVFSDMIENSSYLPGREFFGKPNNYIIKMLKRDNLIPNLSNTSVRVFGVGRSGVGQRKALAQNLSKKMINFWKSYFKAGGSSSVFVGQNLPF